MPAEPGDEFEFIRALTTPCDGGGGVVVGIGDDAAVLRPREGRDLVATTDAFVEGRHFRLDLMTPEVVGSRLARANVSDILAMGAEPRWALLSLSVPPTANRALVVAIQHRCREALGQSGVAIVGGNVTATDGPLVLNMTLLGDVERGRQWTRSGAREGDVLALSGPTGCAGALLAAALWRNPPSLGHVPPSLVETFGAGPSLGGLARALAAHAGVGAAIDISDGFAGDLAHLCAASGVGATIEEARVPVHPGIREVARLLASGLASERADILPGSEQGIIEHLLFGPSDDYELLLALRAERAASVLEAAAAAGHPLAIVGRCTGAAGVLALRRVDGREEPLPGRGYDHFG